MSYRILTIDPGSTSTKIGVFDDEKMLFEENLHHSAEELAQFETIPQQEGLPPPAGPEGAGGAPYPAGEPQRRVRPGRRSQACPRRYLPHHRCHDRHPEKGSLRPPCQQSGRPAGREIGSALHIPSYIVDPPVVDELAPLARYSGHPLITRRSIFHALNQKAVAKRYAKEIGKPYESLNLIVCHMGGGVSVGAHVKGEVVDTGNALEGEGPSPRSGPGRCPAAHWWICASAASIPSRKFAA